MKMINEQEIFDNWSPIIESKTTIKDSNKVEWLSKYCHYHSLNESSSTAYQTLSGLAGFQGQPVAPTRGATGSGDKFPSLLPLAIQVAAKTVGFDIVPVIPMPGPTGVLTYLDYVYGGGQLNSATQPLVIKAGISGTYTVDSTYTTTTVAGANAVLTFVGKSRIDGFPIFRYAAGLLPNTPVSTVFAPASTFTITDDLSATIALTVSAALVPALEDHIAGFTGAGDTDTDGWEGPFATSTGNDGPMTRETGESTYYRSMGLKTFTKFVEAKTYQVAASVTTEQIQDLNKQFGIDVVSMVENALVNEISQSINKHILGTAFTQGATNSTNFAANEGQSLNLNLAALPTVGTFENQMTFQRRIFSRILAAANVVANRGRRGPANFVVCNSQIATAIQDISQFVTAPFANTASQNNGSLYPVGSLAGMTVYVDQNMKWNDTRVLVGRKGSDDEPGIKFMPYMMAESIQTISEGTMSPKIAVKSRYALVLAGFHPETMYFTFSIALPSSGLIV
jgi:hypothetical protein